MYKKKLCSKDISLLNSNEMNLYIDLMSAILRSRYVDYVFGNETEARTFAKVHGWEVIFNFANL